MYAVTKWIAHEFALAKFLVICLESFKNRSNEIGSNEICIRRELPVYNFDENLTSKDSYTVPNNETKYLG